MKLPKIIIINFHNIKNVYIIDFFVFIDYNIHYISQFFFKYFKFFEEQDVLELK